MLAVKYIHLSCVALSFILFFIRGIWMLQASSMLQQRWVKIVPHFIDAVLLVSAIALAWMMSISPIAESWLMAKIIALLLYIALGMVALKRGKTRSIRTISWVAALLVFIYIVLVARSHNAMPWLVL